MNYCYTCGTSCDCDYDDQDDWAKAAVHLLAIIGAVCVLGFVGAVIQKHF